MAVPIMTVSLRLSPKPASDDDLIRLSELNPGYRFERSPRGEVVVSPPAGLPSSWRNGQLFMQVERWNSEGRFGYTFDSSAGFTLPDHWTLCPDVAWVRRERYDALAAAGPITFGPLTPDLVIEIRSASDRRATLLEKAERYRRNGVIVTIVVDPRHGVDVFDATGHRALGRVESYSIAADVLAPAALDLRFADLYD